ncbi:protein phosphatase regulator [Colletotrichum higginsianum]|nr:protein phosphatase regulator [Colletotrichum higginsianum]
MATSNSIRQSPPPLTDERGMPKGAIISPPDSVAKRKTSPNRRRIENLKELQDAISQIPLLAASTTQERALSQDCL